MDSFQGSAAVRASAGNKGSSSSSIESSIKSYLEKKWELKVTQVLFLNDCNLHSWRYKVAEHIEELRGWSKEVRINY